MMDVTDVLREDAGAARARRMVAISVLVHASLAPGHRRARWGRTAGMSAASGDTRSPRSGAAASAATGSRRWEAVR
jgi:hypothetical protein